MIVHGRDAPRGAAVVTVTEAGGNARFVAADLGVPAELDDLAEAAGVVEVLVNNGGFSWFGPTADLDAAAFDRSSPPTSAPPTSWSRRSPRGWPNAAAAASSTWGAWPAGSA